MFISAFWRILMAVNFNVDRADLPAISSLAINCFSAEVADYDLERWYWWSFVKGGLAGVSTLNAA